MESHSDNEKEPYSYLKESWEAWKICAEIKFKALRVQEEYES